MNFSSFFAPDFVGRAPSPLYIFPSCGVLFIQAPGLCLSLSRDFTLFFFSEAPRKEYLTARLGGGPFFYDLVFDSSHVSQHFILSPSLVFALSTRFWSAYSQLNPQRLDFPPDPPSGNVSLL